MLKNTIFFSDVLFVVYALDNYHGNPFLIWKQAGSPHTPSWKLLRDMRENEVDLLATDLIIITKLLWSFYTESIKVIIMIFIVERIIIMYHQPIY